MLRRVLLVMAVLFTAVLLYGDEGVRGSFDRNLSVNGPVDLQVQTGSGAIRVHAGGNGSVIVHGEIRVRGDNAEQRLQRLQQNPPIQQSGNHIQIGQITDEDLKRNVSISYDVTVPADTRVQASSGSGAMDIGGLKGAVTAHTGSGAVHVADIANELRAETGSGSIAVEDIAGNVYAHTGSGAVRGSNLGPKGNQGRVEVQTGSGSIKLDHIHAALLAHTGSGHIEASGEATGNWDLQTGSGGVDVRLPANASFDVRAHTGSGSISVDQPLTVQGEIGRHSVEGKVRGGGPTVQLRTGSGGIHIASGGSGDAL